MPELDVLRGLAAALMIVNHAGFRLLLIQDAPTSAAGATIFLGSFAPVLYFFATGFGTAIADRPDGRPPALGGLFYKVVLLVIADQFFFWQGGVAWGVDFFSFIALSSVVVSLLARLRHPGTTASVLIAILLGLRYGLGPLVREHIHGHQIAAWILGVEAVTNVSYPLTPWMVYPLLGFVLGRLYAPSSAWSAQRRRLQLGTGFALALALLCGALSMAWLNSVFFRWGTVSAAYFVLSLAVVLTSGLLSVYLSRRHALIAGWIALRGVASFAVIPLHYAMLDLCAAALNLPVGRGTFIVLAVALMWLSFGMARAVSRLMASPWLDRHRRWSFPALLTLLAVLAVATLLSAGHDQNLISVLVLLGQLTAASLLALRPTGLNALASGVFSRPRAG